MDASPSDSGGVGFPPPSVGLSSAKAARGVAEDVLTRGMQAEDFDTDAQTHGLRGRWGDGWWWWWWKPLEVRRCSMFIGSW